MKSALYIVTYDAQEVLNKNLDSILNSDFDISGSEVIVINNHSDLHIDDKFFELLNLRVINNDLRPDFSTGHLARNWNQALINGFKDLNNPDVNFVMTSQDDVMFEKDWYSKVLHHHNKYSFIQYGRGDMFCSYTPEAVKNIGIWDERFCNIGLQEADYFMRAKIFNYNHSTINDPLHGNRILNPINDVIATRIDPEGAEYTEHHLTSGKYHYISLQTLIDKWGNVEWTDVTTNMRPLIKRYYTYPYFEKDISNLLDKGYFIDIS